MRVRVTERDLRHDADSARFGNAMLTCEGYAPGCSETGRCQRDGQCFASNPSLVAARLIEGLIPTSCHARGMHLAYLRKVADMLREGDIHL